MSSTRLLAIIGLLIAVFIIVLAQLDPSERKKRLVLEQEQLPAARSVAALAKRRQESIASHLVIFADSMSKASIAEKESKFVEMFRSTAMALHDLRDFVGKDEIRRQIFDELLKSENAISHAQKILLENRWAREAYGKDQAIARIYAIGMLKRDAEMRTSKVLAQTAMELSHEIANQDGTSSGQFRDLEDLVSAYASTSSVAKIQSELFEMNFSREPKVFAHVREGFLRGLNQKMNQMESYDWVVAHLPVQD